MTYQFTAEQEADLVKRYEDGATVQMLARELGSSFRPVLRIIKAHGVYDGGRPRAGRALSVEQREQVKTRYAAGESIYKLSKEFGMSPNGVWKFLRAHGVEMRFHGRIEGRRSLTDGGYIRIQVDPDDPIAGPMRWVNGFAPEHRVVMARSLGRPLDDTETVHHINGDRTDNRPENLQLRNGRHGRGVVTVCLDCGSHNVGPVPID